MHDNELKHITEIKETNNNRNIHSLTKICQTFCQNFIHHISLTKALIKSLSCASFAVLLSTHPSAIVYTPALRKMTS